MVFRKNSKLQVFSAIVNTALHGKPSKVSPSDSGISFGWEGGNKKL